MKQDRKNRVVKVRVSDKQYEQIARLNTCVSSYIRSLIEAASSAHQ